MAGTAKKGGQKPAAASSKFDRSSRQDGSPALNREIQTQIGDKLRSLYGELVEQPVPDRLAELLRKLG